MSFRFFVGYPKRSLFRISLSPLLSNPIVTANSPRRGRTGPERPETSFRESFARAAARRAFSWYRLRSLSPLVWRVRYFALQRARARPISFLKRADLSRIALLVAGLQRQAPRCLTQKPPAVGLTPTVIKVACTCGVIGQRGTRG